MILRYTEASSSVQNQKFQTNGFQQLATWQNFSDYVRNCIDGLSQIQMCHQVGSVDDRQVTDVSAISYLAQVPHNLQFYITVRTNPWIWIFDKITFSASVGTHSVFICKIKLKIYAFIKKFFAKKSYFYFYLCLKTLLFKLNYKCKIFISFFCIL